MLHKLTLLVSYFSFWLPYMKKHNPNKDPTSVCIWGLKFFAHICQEKPNTSLSWIQTQKQRFVCHFLNLDCVALRLTEDAFLIEGAPPSLSNKLRGYEKLITIALYRRIAYFFLCELSSLHVHQLKRNPNRKQR